MAPKTRIKPIIVIVTGLVTTSVIAAIIWLGGRVDGTEFSPSHFQLRQFSFYEIPLTGMQVTPIRRTDESLPVAQMLRAKNFVDVDPAAEKTWHLATIQRAGVTPTTADAGLLVDQLRLRKDTNEFWRKWSTDHPEAAKVLWPTVKALAEDELYLMIPALMRLACNQTEAGPLRRQIDQHLEKQIGPFVSDLRQSGRADLADQIEQRSESGGWLPSS